MSRTNTIVYVAAYGDYLAKIAEEHGTSWQAIWNHPLNAEHRRKRGSPDVLYPGDVLHIPSVPAPPPATPGPPRRPPTPPPFAPPPIWPYPPPPGKLQPSVPTWDCPEGRCVCTEPVLPVESEEHTVFLHDDRSRRMPHAQCRVHLRGRPLESPVQADATGAVSFATPPGVRTLILEWAPAEAPLEPTFPYRRVYHLEPGVDGEQAVQKRLEHIGVSRDLLLEDQIREFQAAYGLHLDGEVESVLAPLLAYHDTGMLPPIPDEAQYGTPVTPLPPDVRPPKQGAISAVSDRAGDCHVSLQLLDASDAPVANVPFSLEIGGGRSYVDRTDEQGRLEFGDLAAGDYALTVAAIRLHVPAIRKKERHRPIYAIED